MFEELFGLFETFFGIFALSFLANRPLFAANREYKSTQKRPSTKLEIKSKQLLTYSKTRQPHIAVMRCEVQAARHFDGLLLDKKAYEQATDTKSSAIPSLLEYCRGAKEEDEVNENKSITPLRKYIAIGYAVIALLIGGIVFIYMHEWRELEHIPNHKRLRILSATSDKHIR